MAHAEVVRNVRIPEGELSGRVHWSHARDS